MLLAARDEGVHREVLVDVGHLAAGREALDEGLGGALASPPNALGIATAAQAQVELVARWLSRGELVAPEVDAGQGGQPTDGHGRALRLGCELRVGPARRVGHPRLLRPEVCVLVDGRVWWLLVGPMQLARVVVRVVGLAALQRGRVRAEKLIESRPLLLVGPCGREHQQGPVELARGLHDGALRLDAATVPELRRIGRPGAIPAGIELACDAILFAQRSRPLLLLAEPAHPLPQPAHVVDPVLAAWLAREYELGLRECTHERRKEEEPRRIAKSSAPVDGLMQRRITRDGAGLESGDRHHVERCKLAAEVVPGSLAGMEAKRLEGFVERARPRLVRAQIKDDFPVARGHGAVLSVNVLHAGALAEGIAGGLVERELPRVHEGPTRQGPLAARRHEPNQLPLGCGRGRAYVRGHEQHGCPARGAATALSPRVLALATGATTRKLRVKARPGRTRGTTTARGGEREGRADPLQKRRPLQSCQSKPRSLAANFHVTSRPQQVGAPRPTPIAVPRDGLPAAAR